MEPMRQRQQIQTEEATEDGDRIDKPDIVDVDVDIDRADNLGRDTEEDTNSNSNGNSNTRRPKIVSFFVNNITDYNYSMQLTTKMMKLIKNLLGFKEPNTTNVIVAIAKPTPNILNFVSFSLTINQAILSKLQLTQR